MTTPAQPAPPTTAAAQAPRRSLRVPTELRTSEGRAHLILQLILLANTVGIADYVPQRYTVIAQAILGTGYALARGLAKTGSAGTR